MPRIRDAYQKRMSRLRHTCGFDGMGAWMFVPGCPKCEAKRAEFNERVSSRGSEDQFTIHHTAGRKPDMDGR